MASKHTRSKPNWASTRSVGARTPSGSAVGTGRGFLLFGTVFAQVIWVKQHEQEDRDPQIPTRKVHRRCDQCGRLCGGSANIHVTVHSSACSLERETGGEREGIRECILILNTGLWRDGLYPVNSGTSSVVTTFAMSQQR